MDRITGPLLEQFTREHGLAALPEEDRFEHFATFLVLGRHCAESFDTRDVVVGGGNDTGIDGLAVLVNGALVTDVDAFSDIASKPGSLDPTFVFVQAERSSNFETAKVATFGFGAVDFFSETPRLTRSETITEAADLASAVFQQSGRFHRGNPTCRLAYVTTGQWRGDNNLEARRDGVVQDLRQLGLFRDVTFDFLGADDVRRLFVATQNAVSKAFSFPNRIVVPEIPGVKEAYVGLLPAKEFVALLDDGSGQILRSVFYDNVRDFQDYNAVNSNMRETLASDIDRRRFAVMNNGITIIAKNMLATGNRLQIEDFQVVNGCQTSHVLFDARDTLDESVVVPLRLICSDDEAVIASIVKATNRQTEVKDEQLLALSDFQKKLEAFFPTARRDQPLYYERRSRQYNALAHVEKTRIVAPRDLIRAFAATCLEEPHRTTRNYSGLMETLGRRIFGPEDRVELYFYAASALYRLEFLFRRGLLASTPRAARYHLLLAARLLLTPDPMPRANSREAAAWAERHSQAMWDPDMAQGLFENAATVVADVAGGNFHRDNIRTEPFTERVKAQAIARSAQRTA